VVVIGIEGESPGVGLEGDSKGLVKVNRGCIGDGAAAEFAAAMPPSSTVVTNVVLERGDTTVVDNPAKGFIIKEGALVGLKIGGGLDKDTGGDTAVAAAAAAATAAAAAGGMIASGLSVTATVLPASISMLSSSSSPPFPLSRGAFARASLADALCTALFHSSAATTSNKSANKAPRLEPAAVAVVALAAAAAAATAAAAPSPPTPTVPLLAAATEAVR